jgi:hypothetical protein
MTDLACALHVHSLHSGGTGTIPEIAAAASDAGIDVVVVTDHETLAGRSEEGWYGDTLVLVGIELSPKRRDHYLAFGLTEAIAHNGMDAGAMCDAVQAAGGFGFAAHPFSGGSQMHGLRHAAQPQPWADLENPAIAGIEVWNVGRDGLERAASPRAPARFARDPLAEFPAPNPEALEAWDRLGARRRTVGIAGLDAHQNGIRVRTHVVTPLSYEALFRQVRTHVVTAGSLTGELEFDRALVYDALRSGRCYMAVDALAPASGFDFRASQGSAELPMGAEAPAGGWTLEADLPVPASLTLRCDGRTIARAEDDAVAFATDEPGVFRVEARLGSVIWLLSNPVYLRPD